ncbi:dnaJ homolog subfamily C member 16 [Daktulosphaira vitifoliae]|uniref:dnaJ homolog subfamily C member 16 n=1 Tax=Daktulosphaira vitifoliae TaxID=58002 RepID=UPI0021AA9F97|nr:dnaJ homolog subfamily C member 16 [Daktulosphaira vitifoliae]
MKWRLISTVLFITLLVVKSSAQDPYSVLGVSRSASISAIKNAYRTLVKKWHPDKNTNPEATSKFIEITKAYETLMNKENQNNNVFSTNSYTSSFNQFFDFDMDNFFDSMHQQQNFEFFRKLQINLDDFNKLMVTKKSKKLTLILFYSEFSLAFLKTQSVFKKSIEDLTAIGVDFKTMNKDMEPSAFWRAKGVFVPHLVSIIDSNLLVCQDSLLSGDNIINFARKSLPDDLIPEFNDRNLDKFLNAWSSDNRVRALVMQPNSPLRLRYALIALEYRNHINFGFVNIGRSECHLIRDRYKVPYDKDTLLILKENIIQPVAHLSMPKIPVVGLRNLIESNKYLTLPRLSSQDVFDTLCPIGEKRFCLVLVSHNSPSHEAHRQSIRRFAIESKTIYPDDQLAFMYVFRERQPHFINSLIQGGESPSEPLLHIVLLTRVNKIMVNYKWLLGDKYNDWANYELTKERLTRELNALLDSASTLKNEVHIGVVLDEHGQSLLMRIAARAKLHIISIFYGTIDGIINHGFFYMYMVLLMIGLMTLFYYMYTLVEKEMKEIDGKMGNQSKSKVSQVPKQRELKLHELRAETYNGLVRLIKPGCRTIILLIDNNSAVVLVRQFYNIVWPYRKNKSLMFGYLNLDRIPSKEWYRELLSLSFVDTDKRIHINTKNCVGTVLSLCSLKKYFCMYHAKHPESSRHKNDKWRRVGTKPPKNGEEFWGFDEQSEEESLSYDEDEESTVGFKPILKDKEEDIRIENLLDGLPMWLDRLFEGSTTRYQINYWPDFRVW